MKCHQRDTEENRRCAQIRMIRTSRFKGNYCEGVRDSIRRNVPLTSGVIDAKTENLRSSAVRFPVFVSIRGYSLYSLCLCGEI
jgi:hypothetical protein